MKSRHFLKSVIASFLLIGLVSVSATSYGQITTKEIKDRPIVLNDGEQPREATIDDELLAKVREIEESESVFKPGGKQTGSRTCTKLRQEAKEVFGQLEKLKEADRTAMLLTYFDKKRQSEQCLLPELTAAETVMMQKNLEVCYKNYTVWAEDPLINDELVIIAYPSRVKGCDSRHKWQVRKRLPGLAD